MSFPAGAIKEANNHIQALSKANMELEERVKELSGVLRKQNEAHAENLAVLPLRMKQTLLQKDEEIQDLRKTVERLQLESNEKEIMLQHYKNKCKVLDEVARHRESLESILACLDYFKEPDYDEGNNNLPDVSNQVRETDLTNGYCESEEEGRHPKEIPRPNRIDSGIGEENGYSNEIVAL
ncbi:uncharacterized protein LOC116300669 [Actinia tenebrosa]|uniref:Uncharacterized protein LOC116300669 n=1 Tax=Actinia tenebrosa TaxID=6105 RepID=A0A6P8IFC8_ACTTE|nr:uncharacterized protein LOC116300669 [Actinia tenebrosa]